MQQSKISERITEPKNIMPPEGAVNRSSMRDRSVVVRLPNKANQWNVLTVVKLIEVLKEKGAVENRQIHNSKASLEL